jgi:hypothetical protein
MLLLPERQNGPEPVKLQKAISLGNRGALFEKAFSLKTFFEVLVN